MRVALGQLAVVWEDKEKSFQKAEKMIIEAKKQNSDIIVFPEMSFTGFSMNIKKIGEHACSSQTVEKMSAFAKKYEIAIGFGWSALPEGPSDKASNRFTVVDKKGIKLSEYIKIHPFSYGKEDLYYKKGDQIVTFQFMERTISLFICYDLRFPELFQIAAKKADIFLVIANWPAIRSIHWETLLRARAIETQSYVVGVNCFGEFDGNTYSGDSMAVDSIGNILGKISNTDGVLICNLDDRAWNLRQKFSTAKDRQEELYMQYYKKNQEK